jgi:hypothetical protein
MRREPVIQWPDGGRTRSDACFRRSPIEYCVPTVRIVRTRLRSSRLDASMYGKFKRGTYCEQVVRSLGILRLRESIAKPLL